MNLETRINAIEETKSKTSKRTHYCDDSEIADKRWHVGGACDDELHHNWTPIIVSNEK